MSLTSKCTSLSAIDGALDGEHERNDETHVAIARSVVDVGLLGILGPLWILGLLGPRGLLGIRGTDRAYDARCHRVEARDVLAAHAASAVWEAHDGSNAERGAQFGDRVSSDRPEVIQERRDGNQNVVEADEALITAHWSSSTLTRAPRSP